MDRERGSFPESLLLDSSVPIPVRPPTEAVALCHCMNNFDLNYVDFEP